MNGFGDAPIKAEGQAVNYDNDPRMPTFVNKHNYEIEVSFDPRDGEFQGADEEGQE